MKARVRSALAALTGIATVGTFGLGGAAVAAPAPGPGANTNLATLVDTRTWTSGGGNTFPGADVPFGMVQWSPDTAPNGGAGGGYSYSDTSLMGFSLTHLSGPGCGAAGDVPILPMTGALPSGDPNSVTTPFSHTGEVAQAGYYSVQSNQPSTITSEFTATPHSAMGRFTFPPTTSADVLIKLMSSQNGDSADSAQIVGNDEVMGSDTSGNFCGETNNGGQPQQYTVYFDIVFSQPFTASQVVTNPGQTGPAGVFLTFDTTSNPVVEAKVGISYVSTSNAKLNWQTENPGWDFGSVKAAAQASWDSLLGKIQVGGGSAAQTQEFYSLLYKDFMQPNIVSDVNGQFMGSDFQVHTLAPGQHDQYAIFSGWDIYHSLSQLQAMLDPSAASDMAQSLLNYYAENGILQQWGYLNLDNYVMVGDPAQAIIADYYAFGARGFNTSEALADMLKQATTVNDVRPGEALEAKYGYLPADGVYGCCNAHGVVATLLEYDTADLALSFFASALGDQKDATMLEQRANNWENMFDPANGLLNPRLENGQFVPGITPTTQLPGEPYYVEGDAYEYLWDVPNDYSGLFSLLGGDQKVVPALQQYLSQPNGMGMYAELSNEFDLGEQFALDYARDPAGTQAAVNNIRNTMYLPGPSGLANNDDLGAESSQFIWEMLGMYPENPGSDNLVFASPGFPYAQISLPNGNKVTINAPGASPSEYYVASLKLNGHPYNQLYVPFSQLANGATLDWSLTTQPTTWGTAPQDAPPSYTLGLKPAVAFLPNQQVTVAPGGSTTVQVGAQNATGSAQAVQISLSAPSGLTVSPSSGTIHLPPNGSAYLSVTVSASSSTPQTFYSVPITATMTGQPGQGGPPGSGTPVTEDLNLTVLVAEPGSLLTAFNNSGVSQDDNVGGANFDGGGASYSYQALAALGVKPGATVSVAGGLNYTWPLSATGQGFPDNAIASGQTVDLTGTTGARQVGFLGSATNGPSQGLVTLNYSDGTSAQYWLGFSDWTLNGGSSSASYGNVVAAATAYRNCSYCSPVQQTVQTYLFSASLPVDGSKTLTSVTLPSGTTQGNLHVFAIATSTTPMSPPELDSVTPTTASAGQEVTIHGSGFGATQGAGYVQFQDNGVSWGCGPCGNAAGLTIDSWSDTAITFTVPTPSGPNNVWAVYPGSEAMVTVTSSAGATSDTGAFEITPTSNPADYYNNVGISDDSNPGCANLDGDGFSYSAQALAGAGLSPGSTVTSNGLTYTWPNEPACSNDNIVAIGQTMLVANAPAGATTLGFLGTSVNGNSSGPVTINYTDGTSSTETLSFNDWAQGGGGGDTVVATMNYRNYAGQSDVGPTVYVYSTTVPVDPTKTVASVTFPSIGMVGNGVTSMHIFAMALGS